MKMHQVQGSYGGVESLYREAKKQKIKVSRQQVEKWLSKELSYTLHKPVRKRFSRNKTIVFYIDELWQMDLCDTSSLKQFNDGEYIYIKYHRCIFKNWICSFTERQKKVQPY